MHGRDTPSSHGYGPGAFCVITASRPGSSSFTSLETPKWQGLPLSRSGVPLLMLLIVTWVSKSMRLGLFQFSSRLQTYEVQAIRRPKRGIAKGYFPADISQSSLTSFFPVTQAVISQHPLQHSRPPQLLHPVHRQLDIPLHLFQAGGGWQIFSLTSNINDKTVQITRNNYSIASYT